MKPKNCIQPAFDAEFTKKEKQEFLFVHLVVIKPFFAVKYCHYHESDP